MGRTGGTKKRVVVIRRKAGKPTPVSHPPRDSAPVRPSLTELDLLTDTTAYTENLLWIRDKAGSVVPFLLNPVQRAVMRAKHEAKARGRKARFLILKARRQGVTTLEQAGAFHGVSTVPNFQAVTLAHDDKSTEKIFRIANLFYEKLHSEYKPQRLTASNKRDLNFPKLRSLYSIGTAGSRGVGRGDTLNKVHWSEVAWSPGSKEDQRKLLAGLTEAASAGEVTLETTPNGVGDLFHEKFMEARDGKNEWTALFFPWWADPTYRVYCTDEQAREIVRSYTDEEKTLVERHNLDPQQILWRRAQQRELRSLFMQEYPEDPETCFLVSGTCFFDKPTLNELFQFCKEPHAVKQNGELLIFVPPVQGRAYCAGADVAEGEENSHDSVCGVLDVETGEQCAVFRGKWSPDEFARRCAYLGGMYNTALLGVERNNHGHSTLNTLVNVLEYRNLYFHREYDSTGEGTPKVGWPTSPKTRPILLDDLREAVHERHMVIHDRALLEQARTFGPNDKGKYIALHENGDDTIFAWGIAWQIRNAATRHGPSTVPTDYADQLASAANQRMFRPVDMPTMAGGFQSQIPGRLF